MLPALKEASVLRKEIEDGSARTLTEYAQLHQDTGEIAGETQPPAQEGKGGAQA